MLGLELLINIGKVKTLAAQRWTNALDGDMAWVFGGVTGKLQSKPRMFLQTSHVLRNGTWGHWAYEWADSLISSELNVLLGCRMWI